MHVDITTQDPSSLKFVLYDNAINTLELNSQYCSGMKDSGTQRHGPLFICALQIGKIEEANINL
jgi:hypothetical protein